MRNRCLCLVVLFVGLVPKIDSWAQNGPGGIGAVGTSSSLIYWIDANQGRSGNNPVTSLSDLSGHEVTNQINGNPHFVPSTLNNIGVLRLEGDADIETNLTINAGDFPELSVISVYVPRTVLAGSVWGEDNGEWDRFQTDINLVSTLNASVGCGYDPELDSHPCSHIQGLFVPDVPTVSMVNYRDQAYNGTTVTVNGALVSQFTSSAGDYQATGYSNFHVGSIGSNGFRFYGDIAEIIVYGTSLNQTETLILDNYLSAKYDIPFSDESVDLYRMDDEPFNFDYDVAGIGRINAIDLHDDSRGSGIIHFRNPSELDDGEFLFWGHNGGNLDIDVTVDIPVGVSARSARIWTVSEVSLSHSPTDVGAVDISFDLSPLGALSPSTILLLIDTDHDGYFSDETPIESATADGSGDFVFQNVTAIANNVVFTIALAGALNELPVELLSFFVHVLPENYVGLNWVTATEVNSERFNVWRSSNGVDWNLIGFEKAAGNSQQRLSYHWVDTDPIQPKSYYKLEQLDFDGMSTFSSIALAQIDAGVQHTVSPNPTDKTILVKGVSTGSVLFILDSAGRNVTDRVLIIPQNDDTLLIDVESLLPGAYLLLTENGKFHFQRK